MNNIDRKRGWKGYDRNDVQNGILRIPEQVQKLDLQSIHKSMFEHFGGDKRYGLQVDPRNRVAHLYWREIYD